MRILMKLIGNRDVHTNEVEPEARYFAFFLDTEAVRLAGEILMKRLETSPLP